MKPFFLPTLLLAVLLPLVVGCPSLLGVSDDDEPEEARIIPGKSIDNVEIGDDSTTVINKLGEPDEIAIGDYAGYFFLFTQGEHDGLEVTIHEGAQGVQGVGAQSPYDGVTDTGIGIGSPRETVVQALGGPDKVDQLNHDRVKEVYLYDTTSFNLIYRGGKVESLSMGGNIDN